MDEMRTTGGRPMMGSIPGALNRPLLLPPPPPGPRAGNLFLRREMVQRLIEMTEDSFNEGMLGAAVVSVLVVTGILAIIAL